MMLLSNNTLCKYFASQILNTFNMGRIMSQWCPFVWPSVHLSISKTFLPIPTKPERIFLKLLPKGHYIKAICRSYILQCPAKVKFTHRDQKYKNEISWFSISLKPCEIASWKILLIWSTIINLHKKELKHYFQF